MTLRKISDTQTSTATWAASSAGISTDIDRIGLLTRIDFTAETVPSATLGGASQPGSAWHIVQNMTIRGATKTYYDLPGDAGGVGGLLLHIMNMAEGHGQGTTPTLITGPRAIFTPFNFVFHAGSRPRLRPDLDNPFDLTAFVPAGLEGQLTSTWVTGANTSADNTVTINSSVGRFTLHRVMGTDAELREEMRRQGVQAAMVPAWTARTESPTATASDFSDLTDIPTGAFLRKIVVVEQDATGTRPIVGGDTITQLSILLQDANETIVRMTTMGALACHLGPADYLVADDAADAGSMCWAGASVLDLRPYTTPGNPLGTDYGLDLRGLRTGQVRLGKTIATNTSGDDILILFDRLIPHNGPLA